MEPDLFGTRRDEPLGPGAMILRGFAPDPAMIAEVAHIAGLSPFRQMQTPGGRMIGVEMTNCGALGWVTDRERGYRYQPVHPVTGRPWPPIPARLLDLWAEVADHPAPPEACLVNFYDGSAKMGLHQDRDEETFDAPVVSVSLGDDCLFRIGGAERGGSTRSLRLRSGDVFVLGGAGRLAFHGVDRIYPGTSPLLRNGGRINLTLRRVTAAG